MRRFIVFLVRKRLGLRKHQIFRFANQKSEATYYFCGNGLVKIVDGGWPGLCNQEPAGVSLNWLLDDECEIEKLG